MAAEQSRLDNTYRYYFVVRMAERRYVCVQMGRMKNDALCSAATVCCLFLAAGLVAAGPSRLYAAGSSDWPMFRGNPALTGLASGELEKELALLWTFKTEKPVKSSPAVVGNRVFVGSDDGQLYAINFTTGKKD